MKSLFLISLFAVLLLACSSHRRTIDQPAPPDSETREVVTEFFAGRGYELTDGGGSSAPTPWEKEQFNTKHVTIFSVRSRHQVPDLDPNTHFRFRLIIEDFGTPAEAHTRLKRLFDSPPPLPNSEPIKEFPLRRGFVIESTVYTLATDVDAFMPELEVLVKELEKTLKPRDT